MNVTLHPGWRHMEGNQPLVFAEDYVYAVAPRRVAATSAANLITASGASVSLRRICSITHWAYLMRLGMHEAVLRSIESELRQPVGIGDGLSCFCALAGAQAAAANPLVCGAATVAAEPPSTGFAAGLEPGFPLQEVPAPAELSPALSVLGRHWRLAPHARRQNGVCVELGGISFTPTGEFILAAQVERLWQDQLTAVAAAAVERLRDTVHLESELATTPLAAEFARQGWVRRADLLLLAGQPPVLGCVLAPHYNSSLNRAIDGDVAIAAPLLAPCTIPPSAVQVLQLQNSAWSSVTLPNGLCLGPAHPASASLAGPPHVVLSHWLRWAAVRVAQNTKFHERD